MCFEQEVELDDLQRSFPTVCDFRIYLLHTDNQPRKAASYTEIEKKLLAES